MPLLHAPDPPGLPATITRAQALSAGITDGQIQHRVRIRLWTPLAAGVYRREGADPRIEHHHERERLEHRQRALAAAERRPDAVVGLRSAAILHGLPLVTRVPNEVHLLVPPGKARGAAAGVAIHQARGIAQDVQVVPGLTGGLVAVTSVARTVVDIARRHPLADALSVGDEALRRGLMTLEEAVAVLDRLGPVRGSTRAATALWLLTPLRESPLESASAARFIEWGFPTPRLQHEWHDADGFIARSDFDWARRKVAGFADGREKYRTDPSRSRTELLQEARLRPEATVARWGWWDAAGTGIGLYRLLAPLLGIEPPFPRQPERW